MQVKRFFTRKEAATYLGLSKRTLDTLAWKKKGPSFIRLGRKVLYPIEELDRWVEEQGVRIRTRG